MREIKKQSGHLSPKSPITIPALLCSTCAVYDPTNFGVVTSNCFQRSLICAYAFLWWITTSFRFLWFAMRQKSRRFDYTSNQTNIVINEQQLSLFVAATFDLWNKELPFIWLHNRLKLLSTLEINLLKQIVKSCAFVEIVCHSDKHI